MQAGCASEERSEIAHAYEQYRQGMILILAGVSHLGSCDDALAASLKQKVTNYLEHTERLKLQLERPTEPPTKPPTEPLTKPPMEPPTERKEKRKEQRKEEQRKDAKRQRTQLDDANVWLAQLVAEGTAVKVKTIVHGESVAEKLEKSPIVLKYKVHREQCRKEAADEAKVKVEDDPSCVVAIAGSVEVQSEDVAEVAAEVADAGTVGD